MATKPPLGSGARFSALTQSLASDPKVNNPKALAAAIGRKKLGKNRFQSLAKKGKAEAESPAEEKGESAATEKAGG